MEFYSSKPSAAFFLNPSEGFDDFGIFTILDAELVPFTTAFTGLFTAVTEVLDGFRRRDGLLIPGYLWFEDGLNFSPGSWRS